MQVKRLLRSACVGLGERVMVVVCVSLRSAWCLHRRVQFECAGGPNLYKAPPKRELTEEERLYVP